MGQPQQISYLAKDWTNSDVKGMALDILKQADEIRDEEPACETRRAHLLRASSKMLEAFAELELLARDAKPYVNIAGSRPLVSR
jgi:hypothetical protein